VFVQNFGSTSAARGGFQNLQKKGMMVDIHNSTKAYNHDGTKAKYHNGTKAEVQNRRVHIP
jgi:hypothetical protein